MNISSFFRLTGDSVSLALDSLKGNRLRTFLSLSGITIGIFCIISVMTIIDSLENAIKENVSSLGEDTVYVQKWPWAFGGEYPWWRYINRPVTNYREYEELKRRTKLAEAISFNASVSATIKLNGNNFENAGVSMVSYDFYKIQELDIEKGRYFNPIEVSLGQNLAIIGYSIYEELFSEHAIHEKGIKIGNKNVNVIGVLKKEGDMMFGNSNDETVIIPITFGRTIYNVNNESLNPYISARPVDGVSAVQLSDELRILMRTIRRLKPTEDDNFAINRSSMVSQGLDNIFSIIDLAGIIIGGFAILIGGFGIANIMFVSVKERTKQIGIQKAIGAKSYLIMIQFLTESITLCIIGGIAGLILIWLGTIVVSSIGAFSIVMSIQNIFSGLLISIFIGLISGYAPAKKAAGLNPVDAINQP